MFNQLLAQSQLSAISDKNVLVREIKEHLEEGQQLKKKTEKEKHNKAKKNLTLSLLMF